MSFLPWVERISSRSGDPQIQWMLRILRGLEPQWLGGWYLVGQRPSSQLSSWPQVWYPRVSWLTHLGVFLWSSMSSCGTLQKNRRHKGGGGGLILLIFLGIIPLLNSQRRDLKDQWFSLWFQARSSLSSHPKRSSVDHRFAMSSLLSLSTTKYFSTYSKLVGIWYGILVVGRRSSIAFRISSWPNILISRCLSKETPVYANLEWWI